MIRANLSAENWTVKGFRGDNLVCIRNDRTLFGPLSFELTSGQVLYLKGPNGAGKTSLLRLICGLMQPESGTFWADGKEISRPLFNQQLIYIGHQTANNGRLSAIENVSVWCRSQGIAVPDTLMALLGKLGLAGLEDVPVGQLSAGQKRRAALARLWCKPSAMWVLDEPYTALDKAAIGVVENKINEFVSQGGMVIMTSHQTPQNINALLELELDYQW